MSTIKTEEQWEAEGLGINGMQCVYDGDGNGYKGQKDDLIISGRSGQRYIANSRFWTSDDRVYRKIPVAKQWDCDSREEALQALATQAQELNMGYETKAKTYDDGKPPLARLPWAAIEELSMVQLYGQQKYGDFDNYRKGMEVSRNLSCAIRHISKFMDGIDTDSESNRSHLGHALCRIAFVIQNLKDGTAIDDRYKTPFATKDENPLNTNASRQ